LIILKLVAEKSRASTPEDFLHKLVSVGKQLAEVRQSMSPIRNRVARVIYELLHESRRDLDSLKSFTIHKVNEIVERSKEASLKISENAKKLVENRRVITHSCSSTVIEILKAKGVNVIVSESRPLYEGRRVARELSEFGIPVTLITDASVGYFASKADIALVGADTILADGSLVNKMGTYLLALSSRKSNVPFYVACELDKLSSYSPREIELEEKEASEVLSEKLPNVTIRNIYFDITPAELVTKIITEKGMMEPYEAVDYAREMEEHLKQIYSE
jgi:eIF-2B alpha/beta/delta-like uncharacterized protein